MEKVQNAFEQRALLKNVNFLLIKYIYVNTIEQYIKFNQYMSSSRRLLTFEIFKIRIHKTLSVYSSETKLLSSIQRAYSRTRINSQLSS